MYQNSLPAQAVLVGSLSVDKHKKYVTLKLERRSLMHTIHQMHIDGPVDVSRLVACARELLEHAQKTRSSVVSLPSFDPRTDAVTILTCSSALLQLRTHILMIIVQQDQKLTIRDKNQLCRSENELGQVLGDLSRLVSALIGGRDRSRLQ